MFAIFLFMIFTAVPLARCGGIDDTPTAYEVLQQYDFPIGLLPKGVLGYKLDSSTGKFSVHLNGSCSFSIQSYELKYKSTFTGVIAKRKLSELSGIQVKILFLWLSITKVTRDDDELEFSVGITSADFPVDNFNECPTCGCGFDCDSRKIGNGGLLSSSWFRSWCLLLDFVLYVYGN